MSDEDKDMLNSWLEGAAAARSRSIEVAKHLVTSDSGKMEVTFRHNIEVPIRRESPKRAHKFFTAEGFAAYLKKWADSSLLVLANPGDGNVVAVLNEQAKDGVEVVTFSPVYHPLLVPWLSILAGTGETRFPLDNFLKFVRQNAGVIVMPSPKDLIVALCQIKVSKSIQSHYGADGLGLNGVLVETTIQSQTAKSVVSLPDQLVIALPMYVGLDTVRLVIDLAVTIDESEKKPTPYVACWSPNFQGVKIDEFEVMLDIVREVNGEIPDAVIDLGKVGHAAWDYVV